MKILFSLINMNLGGTEKAFLNLLNTIPQEYEIHLLLLENKGELLSKLPSRVRVLDLENSDILNTFINKGRKKFLFSAITEAPFKLLTGIFLNKKAKSDSNSFSLLSPFLKPLVETYDIAVAYAGPHNFISYYISELVKAQLKVQWIHFDVDKIFFDPKFYDSVLENYKVVNCVSTQVAENFKQKVPKQAQKVHVFHNVVDTAEIFSLANENKPEEFKENEINIVTVGRLSEEKGHIDYLPLFQRLHKDGTKIKWWIVGDGNSRLSIEEKIKELGLQEIVILVGKKINPYPYYKYTDIYLQPSKYEGHCVAILEAKLFDKPILCNDFAGARDEISDGVNGYIASTDLEDQYAKIMKLIEQTGKVMGI